MLVEVGNLKSQNFFLTLTFADEFLNVANGSLLIGSKKYSLGTLSVNLPFDLSINCFPLVSTLNKQLLTASSTGLPKNQIVQLAIIDVFAKRINKVVLQILKI